MCAVIRRAAASICLGKLPIKLCVGVDIATVDAGPVGLISNRSRSIIYQ